MSHPPGQDPAQFDSAWKCALDWLLEDCLTTCFPALGAVLDFARPVTGLDTELHPPAPSAAPAASACHADRVLRCFTRDEREICLHIEVQCQREEHFAERMFVYHALLYARYRIPVVSLAILGDGNANWRPSHFRYEFGDSTLSMHFGTVKLLDLQPALPALLGAQSGFALFVAAHLEILRTKGEPFERLLAKCRLSKILCKFSWKEEQIARMMELLDRLMILPQELDALYRRTFIREDQMYVSLWDRLKEDLWQDWLRAEGERLRVERKQGREEGREAGREEGQEQGRRMLLLDLVQQRFGPLPPQAIARLDNASADEIQRWSKRFCDAGTLDELLG